MDLPDCPPGAEGYEDSVVEKAKKPGEESSCTKAEQEFQEHLNSLKIRLENGETRCMVERRGRDISGKWIYLCYPCGSVCSGESILQTHISGKKHKIKLSMKTAWPMSIFDDHPFNQNQKSGPPVSTATEKVLQKMAAAVEIHKQEPSDLDHKYNKYREATCHIQEALDKLKAPLVGVEYLVEHPPELPHYEPSYLCTLCTKQGHPRTIVNHLTCYWHRYNYLLRHFPKACQRLGPFKNATKYREGVQIILHRLTQRVVDKFGTQRPVNIDKEIFEREKDQILQWIYKGHHFAEKPGLTLEEVVDEGLIESLAARNSERDEKQALLQKNVPVPKKRDPSPPIVAAPSKPHYNQRAGRRERRMSMESLSDISDDDVRRPGGRRPVTAPERAYNRDRLEAKNDRHQEQYAEQRREIEAFRSKYIRDVKEKEDKPPPKGREPYKVKLAEEKRQAAAEAAAQMLAYHEKNPEKHPLYPEEWKKFWNRRYKEIQAEGKDPAKHDFKPEWIVFWTKRMKELHEEELQMQVSEIYRRMNLNPPDTKREEPKLDKRLTSGRKSPERRRSPDRRRSPGRGGRRSPEPRRRSPEPRRRSPQPRKRSPYRDYKPEPRVFPDPRYSIDRRGQPPVRPSPPKRPRSRSPLPRHRSPSRTNISLESARRSRSPLSRRDADLRNRSPQPHPHPHRPARSRSPPAAARELAPSLQTVMISDDELRAEDELSPWNSDNDIDSISSMSRSARAPSHASSRARYPAPRHEPQDLGPAENVVATLRVLVALEDYLGSLGPKIVDLLTDALKMEKERANSSEELLERESAVVLIETAKEKLKGAAQAGLVPPAAAPALRAAIVRAAATLHEADTRARRRLADKKVKPAAPAKTEAVPVAGVGEVDRAQIAQQMAAALIAQGKTDVTSEELAQLVDAVVGMAEAKKREAEASRKVEPPRPAPPAPRPAPTKLSGTATALQMLQSAYDENDKKAEREDVPDAMDGLSDSDLETLLKNFNELSAEEQHSLIAYLKKLEAREPQRVERLRQYVSAAATATPPATVTAAPPAAEEPLPAPEKDIKPVTIESDDDDYTVEEVFQSATQKVKEDQIRKEMDIVKKSLEELKEDEPEPEPLPPVKAVPIVELSKQMSSASDLFALVQASIKSTSAAPAASAQNIDVVASATQPRSFGDAPEKPIESLSKPQISPSIPISAEPIATVNMQDSRPLQNQSNMNRNFDDENDSYSQALQWDKNNIDNNRGPPMSDKGYNDYDQGQGMREPGPNHFVSNSGPGQFDQGRQFGQDSGPNRFGQGNMGFNQGSNSGFGQGPNSSGFGAGSTGLNQGPNSGPNQFNQGPNQYGQGPNSGPNRFGQGPGSNQYGQGPNQFSPGPTQDWHGNQGPTSDWQGNQGPSGWQGNQGSNQPWQAPNSYQQNQGMRDNFMNGGRMDNFDNRPPFDNNQQFGKNNFRGRGGGGGGRGRGRGRGRF